MLSVQQAVFLQTSLFLTYLCLRFRTADMSCGANDLQTLIVRLQTLKTERANKARDYNNRLKYIENEFLQITDGGWSNWGEWSTCEGGIQSRRRNCSNPAPSKLGKQCLGNTDDFVVCNKQQYHCPFYCRYPPNIANGRILNMTGRRSNDSFTVECDDGFHLSESKVANCTSNGQWTQIPSCVANIDECSSSPCLNGGTCNNMINSYTCSCRPVFTGTHCEQDCYPTTTWAYNGTRDRTAGGILCQRWDSQTPHAHTYTDLQYFPEATLAEAKNYCRNPDPVDYRPWCVTTGPSPWEYCDVTEC